ncbi:F-box protein At5g49610-like [Panicum virgatum]|uniref:F-box domain-containing protein n=1 Tax=Panicum virgatum TaxID=38727 RepID=A0A8T0PN81_PANVG|nr:F-box protein At5g49610-like [Panicum virgatum]KAG2562039.1 hypothetical protein PVAP13_8KG173100 [Panicum virgatum]
MEEEEEEGSKKDNSLVSEAEAEAAAAAAAAASLLTDDLIMEILSRLPVRSVHRFKCVCKRWRDLIACPAHREKLPQTLAGFLYTTYPGGYRHHLAAVSAATVIDSVDASLAFLRPMNYTKIRLVDTCNGLLLCSCYNNNNEERLVVCNPATQRWTELPPPPQPQPTTDYCAQHLAFDPAVSPSHFCVLDFEATVKEWHLTGVSIYSSRTRAWTHRDIGLVDKIVLVSGSVFVGGMLHLPGKLCKDGRNSIEDDDNFVLVLVDKECKAWKTVRAPRGFYSGAIGLSQECLHYVTRSPAPLTILDDDNEDTLLLASEIAVWCLKDYDSREWVLKHTVRIDKLLNVIEKEYSVVGIHPDCDTIFFVTRGAYDGDSWDDASLASWDMRRLEFRTVINLEKGSAGIYLPYVPMFSESTLADGDDL